MHRSAFIGSALFVALLSSFLVGLPSSSPTVVLAPDCSESPGGKCERSISMDKPAGCLAFFVFVNADTGNEDGSCKCDPPQQGTCMPDEQCKGNGSATIGATGTQSARKGAQCADAPGTVVACSSTWILTCGNQSELSCEAEIWDDGCGEPGAAKVCTVKMVFGCDGCVGACP